MNGYTIGVYEFPGSIIAEWHSTDFVVWESVSPSGESLRLFDGIIRPPGSEPQVDPPPSQCAERENCGWLFEVDGGWLWADTPGDAKPILFASVDGDKWEEIDTRVVTGEDDMTTGDGPSGIGFDSAAVGNVAVFAGYVVDSYWEFQCPNGEPPCGLGPPDTALAARYWVIQLP